MGAICMGVWFILYAVVALVPIPSGAIILAVLAFVVGILLLAGK